MICKATAEVSRASHGHHRQEAAVRAALIFNPSSGRGRAGAIASAVEQGLTKRGLDCELHATRHAKEAIVIAERCTPKVDIVVAIGGDGTVNEVANGMARARQKAAPGVRQPLLGIVPAGTVNVLALELGLPFQVERACNVIAGRKTISLDLGKVNGRWFLLMMGAGIDALTVRNIDPQAKKRFKELAFIGTGLKAGMAQRPPVFLVRTNGEEYRATFFVAGNSRYYGGKFGITSMADPTDGVLDLVLYTGTGRAGLAGFWLGVPTGLHVRSKNVLYLHAQKAEVLPLEGGGEPIWFQTDGELAGRLPATVEIDPHAIEVLVP
jgi:YegS/Rv2252/BmrU family lipid kinase